MENDGSVRIFAPAKVNLALHVTGQRADGYHLLDSLIVFADVGDTLTVSPGGQGRLFLSGAFADQLGSEKNNLILRVAERLWPGAPISFHLQKDLPVASGIGGGSADAAACYRAIRFLQTGGASGGSLQDNDPEALQHLLEIGADVPACVQSTPAIMRGIGERITPLDGFPALSAVLVNAGVAVSTPQVFNALTKKTNPPLAVLPDDLTAPGLLDWLRRQRNDLEAPAIAQVPQIAETLEALENTRGCALARMSGSGATCFGLYLHTDDAEAAAQALARNYGDWWVRATRFDAKNRSIPQVIRSTT